MLVISFPLVLNKSPFASQFIMDLMAAENRILKGDVLAEFRQSGNRWARVYRAKEGKRAINGEDDVSFTNGRRIRILGRGSCERGGY